MVCVCILGHRWVDEVIPDAPWVISQEFIDKHNIDYVAHDALPYVSLLYLSFFLFPLNACFCFSYIK